MPVENFDIANILLADYRQASITTYGRLEATPRTANFERSLKAEIRDPLWMLTRQWQFGEFRGEDAASAIGTKILGEHTVMDQVQFPGNEIFSYDETIPLETTVEREKLNVNLFLAVQMGRYFIKLVKNNPGFNARFDAWLIKYPLNYFPESNDLEGNQLLNAVKGKIFDGYTLYMDIISGSLSLEDANNFPTEIESFRNWFIRNYSQPDEGIHSPWQPSQLEYRFALTTSAEQEQQKILVADQYHEGHLDWYSFDNHTAAISTNAPNNKEHISSFIPSPVSFKGMPNPRFWTMEESQTDFGKIDTSATGLLHLLFAEFGLICSSDWFMLPYPLSVNTLCEVKGIVVTDVFGHHILVRPAGRGPESQWQRWAMFHHTNINKTANDNTNSFYLVPSITKSLESDPLEQVNFLRDEIANLVWAVEKVVPSQSGRGMSGDEMALKEEVTVPAGPSIAGAPEIRYVLGTSVPDNWIPFLPVHIDGSNTEIRLQRAAMPAAKGALGRILTEKTAPYFIDEEIIYRHGLQVSISAQRARWFDGKTYLWYGRKKEAGKGEGLSNLKFDQIEDLT